MKKLVLLILVTFMLASCDNSKIPSTNIFGGELLNLEIYNTSGEFFTPVVSRNEIKTFEVIEIFGTNIDEKNIRFEISDLVDEYDYNYIYYLKIIYSKDTQNEIQDPISINTLKILINGNDVDYNINKFIIKPLDLNISDQLVFYTSPVNVLTELMYYFTEFQVLEDATLNKVYLSNTSMSDTDIVLQLEREIISDNIDSNNIFYQISRDNQYYINFDLNNLEKKYFFYSDVLIEYTVDDKTHVAITPTYFTIWDFQLDELKEYIRSRG